jgi:hypothetical protein
MPPTNSFSSKPAQAIAKTGERIMRAIHISGATALASVVLSGVLWGSEPQSIEDARFETLHAMVKRQPGESRWMEIDWYSSVWEARKKAAEQGKPIFLMAGSGGAPVAGC